MFANVTEVEAAVVPTTTGGNASDVRAAVAIGVGRSTLLPVSGMAVVPVFAVIVRLPERAPAAAGVKTSTAVQLPPGTMLVTQLLVEVNSGLGVAATCVTVNFGPSDATVELSGAQAQDGTEREKQAYCQHVQDVAAAERTIDTGLSGFGRVGPSDSNPTLKQAVVG